MKQFVVGFFLATLLASSQAQVSPIFHKIGQFEFEDPVTQKHYVSTYYDSQNLKMLWHDAFVFCKAFGMELAMFETKEEHDYVMDKLQNSWLNYIGTDQLLIGGTRIGSKDLNDWYWAATGKKINYPLRWAPGQPDNKDDNEYCLNIWVQDNKVLINDCECTFKKEGYTERQFLCERVQIKDDFCTDICLDSLS